MSKICSRCDNPHDNEFSLCIKCKEIVDKSYKKVREFYKAGGICLLCKKEKVTNGYVSCKTCRDKRSKYRSDKRLAYIKDKKCNNCGKPSEKEYCKKCHKQHLDGARKVAHKNKVAVMKHYSNSVCCCCKEAELEFLSIDHINGDGAKHRTEVFKNRDFGGEKFYSWLIKNNYPQGYQVLCFNCNYGKYYNGQCPHQVAIREPSTPSQRYGVRIKAKIIVAYGNKCACCGIEAAPFLTVDHINGRNGDKLRGDKLYRWLVKNDFPTDFQLLCFNCNISKYLSKQCVHKKFDIL